MPCKVPHTLVRGILCCRSAGEQARVALGLGATHAVADAGQAQQLITDLTLGVGADQALITVGVVTEDVIADAFAAVRKAGTVVVTGLAGPGQKNIQVPSFELTLFAKRIQGALFGGGNPFEEIPRMLDMYRAGKLKLDELVTRRYSLAEVQQGYQDLVDGKNIRGVLIHEH
jgi:S-(hydroxymethyl)glutathione dehydrogenase/alcohol dehydrogenase